MVRRRQRDKQWTQTFRQEGKQLGVMAAARHQQVDILRRVYRHWEGRRSPDRHGRQADLVGLQTIPVDRQAIPAGRQAIPVGKQAIPVGRQAIPVESVRTKD